MKQLFSVLFIISCLTASAKNYYISSVSGNDANSGTSTTAAWKTITKLNSSFSTLLPGDAVLFNRGETFYGSIIVSKSGSSGSPIVIGAYGTGANPVITGFTTVNTWTNLGNNIWADCIRTRTEPQSCRSISPVQGECDRDVSPNSLLDGRAFGGPFGHRAVVEAHIIAEIL